MHVDLELLSIIRSNHQSIRQEWHHLQRILNFTDLNIKLDLKLGPHDGRYFTPHGALCSGGALLTRSQQGHGSQIIHSLKFPFKMWVTTLCDSESPILNSNSILGLSKWHRSSRAWQRVPGWTHLSSSNVIWLERFCSPQFPALQQREKSFFVLHAGRAVHTSAEKGEGVTRKVRHHGSVN